MENKKLPHNCICGAKAHADACLRSGGKLAHYVLCTTFKCWHGPDEPTKEEAIAAWNERMMQEYEKEDRVEAAIAKLKLELKTCGRGKGVVGDHIIIEAYEQVMHLVIDILEGKQ
jgi:hypothetical protein